MIKNSIKRKSSVVVLIVLILTINLFVNVNAFTVNNTIKIKDFGAHSIDDVGYSKFDSSAAINKAIHFSKNNGTPDIDFGNGRYYAKDIDLASDITYFSTQKAELIASPDIQVWHSVLTANFQNNIIIKGLTINGNKDIVLGNDQQGSELIALYTSNNITISNCYLYNNWYIAILLQDNSNYVTVKNNKIYDTDCGIASSQGASSNILIDGNTIYGNKNQKSEPIAIYNTNNKLAHDITITNNVVHDKLDASGILVMNATKVLIKGNTAYNVYQGINVGIDYSMTGTQVSVSSDITITENNIYNCTGGVISEVNNSLITKNIISNLKGVGIWLTKRNVQAPISNNIIFDNKITNINSCGGQEPAIRLENTSNCVVDKNNVSDTRAKILHYFAIQITGEKSSNNIIKNNIHLGSIVKNSYHIFLQSGKNSTIKNNIAKILDQGMDSLLLNNKK